jgi:uncharacterized protein (TIGR02246 family)
MLYLRRQVAVALAFGLAVSVGVRVSAQSPEQAQIVEAFDRIRAAWVKGDIDTMLASCTDDIEYVTATGTWGRGKDALRKEWTENYKQGAIVPTRVETSVRTVAPNVATLITRVSTNAVTLASGVRVPAGQGLMTIVFVKQGARWLMASEHTSILPVAAAKP